MDVLSIHTFIKILFSRFGFGHEPFIDWKCPVSGIKKILVSKISHEQSVSCHQLPIMWSLLWKLTSFLELRLFHNRQQKLAIFID